MRAVFSLHYFQLFLFQHLSGNGHVQGSNHVFGSHSAPAVGGTQITLPDGANPIWLWIPIAPEILWPKAGKRSTWEEVEKELILKFICP